MEHISYQKNIMSEVQIWIHTFEWKQYNEKEKNFGLTYNHLFPKSINPECILVCFKNTDQVLIKCFEQQRPKKLLTVFQC